MSKKEVFAIFIVVAIVLLSVFILAKINPVASTQTQTQTNSGNSLSFLLGISPTFTFVILSTAGLLGLSLLIVLLTSKKKKKGK